MLMKIYEVKQLNDKVYGEKHYISEIDISRDGKWYISNLYLISSYPRRQNSSVFETCVVKVISSLSLFREVFGYGFN